MIDICIIGAGAAGMAAAIPAAAGAPGSSVVILEKGDRPGRKIRASGNGRCNLTNTACARSREVRAFFRSIGVQTTEEREGRVYPSSFDAADVAEALSERCRALGVEIRCGTACETVERISGGFAVGFVQGKKKGTLKCRKLLLATGGKAAPQLGTTGDGYRLAGKLGISVTRLAPSLTAVEIVSGNRDLAGVRADAEVSLYYRGREYFRERGEVQFTEYGISGICVFNLSRKLVLPAGERLEGGFREYEIRIDLLPSLSFEEAKQLIQEQMEAGLTGPAILRSIVRKPLAERIWKEAGEDPKKIAGICKAFRMRPSGLRGWKYAQVTRGGVPYSEVNEETMECIRVPGLYLAGELMDSDGPCGGWNLQHAWESGIRAGKGMIR